MTTRSRITLLIYGMVNAVLFGAGAVAVLAVANEEQWKYLLPLVIVLSFILAVPAAWIVAPRMRARFWREERDAVPR